MPFSQGLTTRSYIGPSSQGADRLTNFILATIVSIVSGVCVYGVLLLLLRGLREKELRSFPLGSLIIKIAKKLHLM